ncbi:MAG: S-layer homology domain-containing protein, partial [Oscillospiraceae bacterium]|nr:S-layer homology domain-containing protein [Oscillospiraceae bacterium]
MKKILKKLSAGLLAALVVLSAVPAKASAAVNKQEAYKAYYDFMMSEIEGIGKPETDPDFRKMYTEHLQSTSVNKILHAYLFDVTGDGIEELFIKKKIDTVSTVMIDGYEDDFEWIRIYTCKDGKLVKIGQNGSWVKKHEDSGAYSSYAPPGSIGSILSFEDYPYISDDCVYYCVGQNGNVYLSDNEFEDYISQSFNFYFFNGTRMTQGENFSVMFIPDWRVGDIQSSYGRFIYYVNGEHVSREVFYSKLDFYTGKGVTRLVNNDYHTVLNTLAAAVPDYAQSYYNPSPWAQDYVNTATDAGYLPEQLRKKYKDPITRAEFCKLAAEFYEKTTGSVITEMTTFADCNDVSVRKMGALGVVTGVGDNKFAPDKLLTRQEAAVILARLSNVMGTSFPTQEIDFTDNDKIADWAKTQVGQMVASGVMNGVGEGRFDPLSSYTREQAITTMVRTGAALTPVESVSLTGKYTFYRVGHSEVLTPVITPANAANQQLKWESSDSSVVNVSSVGVITAKGVGTAVITATAASGVSASCTVKVEHEADFIDISVMNSTVNCLNLVEVRNYGYGDSYKISPDLTYDYHPIGAFLTGTFTVNKAERNGTTLTLGGIVSSVEQGMDEQFFPYLKWYIVDDAGRTVKKGVATATNKYGSYEISPGIRGNGDTDIVFTISLDGLEDKAYKLKFLNESGETKTDAKNRPTVNMPDFPLILNGSYSYWAGTNRTEPLQCEVISVEPQMTYTKYGYSTSFVFTVRPLVVSSNSFMGQGINWKLLDSSGTQVYASGFSIGSDTGSDYTENAYCCTLD